MFFEINNLEKNFGGVKAIDGVNLTVNEGETCAIIGPNGAGKTTLFNLITGYLKPDAGRIIFRDENITKKSPQFITRQGIARSFQIVNIFQKLTVYENIMVAILAYKRKILNILYPAKKLLRAECFQLLKSMGLTKEANMIAGQLSHGGQKRLEVSLAIAMKPRFLLLDEPTSGMAAEEKSEIIKTIRNIMFSQQCTVLLCEHDMSVIFEISDTIWVLNNGQVFTHGTVEEIRRNEGVREIYLGGKE